MANVPVDLEIVARCRRLAGAVATDVQQTIDTHTTVGLERTVLRAYGVEGADPNGTPLANVIVDAIQKKGSLGLGASYVLGAALARGDATVQEAAESLAFGGELPEPTRGPSRDDADRSLRVHTERALSRIDVARDEREAIKARTGPNDPSQGPMKYVIVATGNIYDDATQAKAAAFAGADIVAVIRATAQSLLDYVPEGPTTEGFGGTFATQANFKIIRTALDAISGDLKRYVMQTNYSSGLAMSEIAWMAAVERLDMLLNDAMYGILFRDINMTRTFIDQYFSRRLIARSGIIINTGEDNYLTTADAVERAHTVLASQFINEAFAERAGVKPEKMGLGHAYEIDPWLTDSFLLEVAQAQLIRQIFDKHPIKWMPPTKFKTGDVFHSHVHDAMFNLVGVLTGQSIELLGMFSEAIHTPLLMDRYLSLKSAKYIFNTARNLSDEIEWKPHGRIAERARAILRDAHTLLEDVANRSIWDAIGAGVFADIKRTRTGGKGYHGVVRREDAYLNPLLTALEAS